MKKIIILLFNLVSIYSFGQQDLSGVYFSESGTKIEINKNKFIYTEHYTHLPIWYNDTLAECTIKRIDANFIELNSTSPHQIVYQRLKVLQFSDSTVNDSIKVSFSIPYQRNNLEISVFTNTFKIFDLNYSQNRRELMLPKDVKVITFTVSPGQYFTPHGVDGTFFGILYYSSIEYTIEKGINHIEIKIPAIDDSFFEKYYVKGDYARVTNNSITWKGKVYKKSKKK